MGKKLERGPKLGKSMTLGELAAFVTEAQDNGHGNAEQVFRAHQFRRWHQVGARRRRQAREAEPRVRGAMSITWSPSAIISARTCPQQWFRTYGPGRQPPSGDGRAIEHLALGIAQHAALETAYSHAALATAHRPGTMDRFLGNAVETLAHQWRTLRLPEDDALQAQAVAEIGATLEALPVPHPRNVLGIESDLRFTGRSGTPFKARLDLVLRTGADEIHIRDWKRTGLSSLPKFDDLADDVQLCQQRVAVSEQWPWARRVTVGLFSISSAAETRPFELTLERALYRLDGHEVTAHETETASMYPTRKGEACGSCRVRPQCPAFTA